MTEKATWLPNLVGGVSIWKLAVDLNEPKFFDGRLLVPETEGSESLPVTVRWDLTGLVPLAEAHAKHPADAAAAVADFKACLERVAKVFATPNSGFDKYKEAFTVPSLDAGGGANYFYSPDKKKIFVINWGASPREMGGKAEYVFGYEDWGRVLEGGAVAGAAAAASARAPVGAAAASGAEGEPRSKEEDAKKNKERDKGRAWWIWPVFALVAIALVLLALLLLRSCEEPKGAAGVDAAVGTLADAAVDSASAADADSDASADAAADDAGDAGSDASADAASADGGDAGADAGNDGGSDGGLAANDDDGDGDADDGSSGGASSGGGGGPVVVTIGPAGTGTGGAKAGPHRRHYQREAVKWRVASGNDKVSRTEQAGRRFDVWLGPGRTFEGVRVEWQDASGKWHVH